jgi:hypothetical protein
MQRLEVSGAVRPLYVSLGVKGLRVQLLFLTPPPHSPRALGIVNVFLAKMEFRTQCTAICVVRLWAGMAQSV